MTMNLEKIFILHTSKYSESSLLLSCFSENFGKISLLAKRAKRKKSYLKGILQLFTPLLVHFGKKGNIKTLYYAESISIKIPLSGVGLYSAFYLNEILDRVIIEDSHFVSLFHMYKNSLIKLASNDNIESTLRVFELDLLKAIGFEVCFLREANSNNFIRSDLIYNYSFNEGFIRAKSKNYLEFKGIDLIAIHNRNFENKQTLFAAKKLNRLLLNYYLGNKPIKSRELFKMVTY